MSVLNNRTLVHPKMMNHSYIYLFHSYKILDPETLNSYFCTMSSFYFVYTDKCSRLSLEILQCLLTKKYEKVF